MGRTIPLFTASFAFFVAALSCAAETVQLQAGTFIPVRLAQNVNGSINRTGDKVYFQVTQDVVVDNFIVITKDTWVNGKVTYAKGRKMMGDGGRISIIAASLAAIDGQIVRIERDPLSSEGRTRTASLITNTTLWGPIGLVSKGRAAGIFLDTEFEIEVAETLEIDPTAATQHAPTAVPAGTTLAIEGSFKHDIRPIRFHNGIVGKDFILEFQLPEIDTSEPINPVSVSIRSIYGHKLPKEIHPVTVEYDPKKKLHSATFAFWDVIQFCTPQENNILFEIRLPDSTVATGKTSLNRKWRTK